jgi:hypothetical protein
VAGDDAQTHVTSKTYPFEETVQQSFSLLLHPWHINCAPGAQRAQRGENKKILGEIKECSERD